MDTLKSIVDLFLHLDKHLGELIAEYGLWTYAVLFAIVFCETGLVVTPFLPGDSLLFAAGAFARVGDLNLLLLLVLLTIAAIAGDAVNYAVGNFMGPKVLGRDGRFIKRRYLEKTEEFYARYGGKTIIIARFIPIVRTFAPFLAGVGSMRYRDFAAYNVVGAVVWVVLFTVGGYFFSSIPFVEKNFTLVILAIIAISVLPAVVEAYRERRRRLGRQAAE